MGDVSGGSGDRIGFIQSGLWRELYWRINLTHLRKTTDSAEMVMVSIGDAAGLL